MKIIYYKSMIYDMENNGTLTDCTYETYNETDFTEWLAYIQKNYAQYGEVTWKEVETPKTDDEIRDEKIADVDNRLKELETIPPITKKIDTNEEVLTDLLTNIIPTLQGGVE